MRIYYLNSEYEIGKHLIIATWIDIGGINPKPEDNPRTAINVPYSVLEIDEKLNPALAKQLINNHRIPNKGPALPDRYYVDNSGELVENDTMYVDSPAFPSNMAAV